MRCAIIGYGKMGRAIEKMALQRGHTVTHRIDAENQEELRNITLETTDVAFEFTHAESVLLTLDRLLPTQVPLVVGTTGWYSQAHRVQGLVEKYETGLVYAPNFSIGVLLLFRLNRQLAEWMNNYPHYDCFIEEHHHNQKADAPSGTAIRLAQDILESIDRKHSAVDSASLSERPPFPDELCIASVRAGNIKGIHSVNYVSEIDRLEIKHEAYSRDGFAMGAVWAAEWICARKGFHEFSEVI